MRQVCVGCHPGSLVDTQFQRLDQALAIYNASLAEPAALILDLLRQSGTGNAQAISEAERAWWELLHREEIRACAGESPIGPDPTRWQRVTETGAWFHGRFAPAVRRSGVTQAISRLDRLIATDPLHRSWAAQAAGATGTRTPSHPEVDPR